MHFNPFRSYNKREQERQRLMALKKKAQDDAAMLAKLSSLGVSMSQMEEAMRNLSQSVTRMSKTELLVAALQAWPFPFGIDRSDRSGGPIFIDTEKFEFSVGSLLDIWNHFPMSNWLERQYNESETKDSHAVFDMMAHYPSDTMMSMEGFALMVKHYFDTAYPIPTPEMFSSFSAQAMEQKDYFLPGLKVLNWNSLDGTLWSPVYHVPWTNNELMADHVRRGGALGAFMGSGDHTMIEQAMGTCDCGIYSSVNMSELWQYLSLPDSQAQAMGMDFRFRKEDRRLCIIEPFSNATVWMARKGWKASKAFISEIVGDTISVQDASELMSMVWQRPLDLTQLYREEQPL